MGLVASLLAVFLAFCLLMAGVLAFCLRERRKVDGLGNLQQVSAQIDPPTGEIPPHHHIASASDADDDSRIAMVLFGSIIVGALLALLTGYLVFFKTWDDAAITAKPDRAQAISIHQAPPHPAHARG